MGPGCYAEPCGPTATMATASSREKAKQASVEREAMKSHVAQLPVEISFEWPGHHSAGLHCPFTKYTIDILTSGDNVVHSVVTLCAVKDSL